MLVYNFCDKLKKRDDLLYTPGKVECWIDDFKAYLTSNNKSFPVQNGFVTEVQAFLNNTRRG